MRDTQVIARELTKIARELVASDRQAALDRGLHKVMGDILRNMGSAWETLSDAESGMNYFTRKAKGLVTDDQLRLVSKTKMEAQQLLRAIADSRHELTKNVYLT